MKSIEISLSILESNTTDEQIADQAIAVAEPEKTPSLAEIWVNADNSQAVVTLHFTEK
jgi:hypothetical protein